MAEPLRPAEIDKTLIGGQNTVASNPALLKFSLVQFYKCHVLILVLAGVALIGCPLGAFILGKSLALGLLLEFFAAIALLAQVAVLFAKRRLHRGDLCPALVIDTHPYLVAVLTDLKSRRSAPRLAIKIIGQPLQNMAGGAPGKGARLAAAAFYRGSIRKGIWDDFMPIVINCACGDMKQIERAVASIDPVDWVTIEQALPKLKSKAQGLHKLWEMGS